MSNDRVYESPPQHTRRSEFYNVCLFRPHGENLGDIMHFRGLMNLMDAVWPVNTRNTWHVYAEEKFTTEQLDALSGIFDYIIVCGTPWFWHQLKTSLRYIEFIKLLDKNPQARKLAFAIGASFPVEYENRYAKNIASCSVHHNDTRKILKDVWSQFSYIVTRDKLSVDILGSLGIEAHQEMCSSVFANDKHKFQRPDPEYKLAVFFNINTSHSMDYLTREYRDELYKMQYEFISVHHPRVVCVSRNDVNGYKANAAKYGFNLNHMPHIQLLAPPSKYNTHQAEINIFEILSKAKFIVSGRVHAGIPARSLGVPVICIPVDTRSRCVEDCGGFLAYSCGQLRNQIAKVDSQPPLNLKDERRKYIYHLRKAFKLDC